jgi:beta-glucanase (GH16 family)
MMVPDFFQTPLTSLSLSLDLPYNVYPGEGATFNYTTYLQYGSFSATMKPSTVGGAVTAFIGIGNGADEIDFEFLGGNSQNIQ